MSSRTPRTSRNVVRTGVSIFAILFILVLSFMLGFSKLDSKTQVERKNVEVSAKQSKQDAKSIPKEKDLSASPENSLEEIEVEKNTDTPKPEPAPAVNPEIKYVTASILNIRSGSDTSYPVITTIKLGQQMSVYESNGSWSKVMVNDQTGWVANQFLSDTKPVIKEPESQKTVQKQAPVSNPALALAPATNSTTEKQTANNSLADGLKTVDNNSQLILVTTNGSNTNRAVIRTFEKNSQGQWLPVLTANGYIGKNGFSASKKEGDGKSPIGKYTFGTAFGQNGNPGTRLPWRNITNDDVWVDDSESPLYNTWQSKSQMDGQWNSAESMMHRLYTYGFVINYNTERTPYKGSAIFFHVGSGPTLGCTATSANNVIAILKWLDPSKNPVIIQTPIQEISKY